MGHITKLSPVSRKTVELDRRQFVLTSFAVGGSLMIGLVPTGKANAMASTEPWEQAEGQEFTALLSISPDNVVTVRSTTGDIGNGTLTAPAMFVTEELGCDWSMVRGEFVPAHRDLAEGGKYSSGGALSYFSGRSTADNKMKPFLAIGASARERLKAAAAAKWGVDVATVKAEKSMLTSGSNSATFGEMAAAAATVQLPAEPEPKPRSEWTFLGKEAPKKLQLPGILNGSIKYGIDVQVPGMVYAALRQVPYHGGRLKSVNADAVKNMPGVRAVVVVDPDEVRPGLPEGMRAPFGMAATTNGPQAAVAVIADHYWQAVTALDLLPVEWDAKGGDKWENTKTYYDAVSAALATPKEPNVVVNTGDAEAALAGGATVEAEFMTPYMDHVNMEPLNGTAIVTDDKVEAWLATQHPQQGLFLAADETGVHPDKVLVHQTYVGTGLGRRVYGDDTRMVIAVANKYRGTPVKVVWSREESMRQGRYRQPMGSKISAKLGADGLPEAIKISIAGSGGSARAIDHSPYITGIKNFKAETQNVPSNLMTGPWRGPVFNSNSFMLESFINQCAESAKMDAIEYRRKLLANFEDKAWIKLLDVVAEKSGWGGSLERGLAQGVAIANWGMPAQKGGGPTPFSGTTVACVVTAEVSRRGEIYIPRVDMAVDVGTYINKALLTAQLEGGVVLTLGAAMHEELNIDKGRVVEGNLDTYRIMRQNDQALPTEIHIHYEGNSGHERLSEAGEPPMGPPPPALAHAVFKLTGKWMNTMPFDKIDLG
jgi:isoquinoline 1-oxidoreductase beta subunit